MFRKLGGWLDRLKGQFTSKTEDHYRQAADDIADQWWDAGAEPGDDSAPPDEPVTPNIELWESNGSSEDIEWMTYNHDTGECVIQFMDHGRPDRVYSYPDLPYDEFERLKDGRGPFPRGRQPHYLKLVSTGQAANYYLRNDQHDDLYEYAELDQFRRGDE